MHHSPLLSLKMQVNDPNAYCNMDLWNFIEVMLVMPLAAIIVACMKKLTHLYWLWDRRYLYLFI